MFDDKSLNAGFLIFMVIILFINLSCKSAITPDTAPILNGIVSDRHGNPVAGAMIDLEYFLEGGDVYLPKTHSPQTNTMIRFAIPESGLVKVWITRYQETDTVRVLMNQVAMAGNYMLIWDGRSGTGERVINHFYQSHISYKGAVETSVILINGDYYNEANLDSLAYYTLTDADGKFTIPAEALACHHTEVEIEITDELGNKLGTVKLSREIRIWALHHAHGKTVSEKQTFRAEGPTEVQLRY